MKLIKFKKKQKKAYNNAKGGTINRKCLKIGHVLICGYFKQKIATGSLGKMPNG